MMSSQVSEQWARQLTICGILRRSSDFDENLSRTRLRHVRDAKSDPVFRHKGSSLLGGSHCYAMKREREGGNFYQLRPPGPDVIEPKVVFVRDGSA